MLLAVNCYTDANGSWPLIVLGVLGVALLVWNRAIAGALGEFIGPWRGNPSGRQRDGLDDTLGHETARAMVLILGLAMIGLSLYALLATCPPNE